MAFLEAQIPQPKSTTNYKSTTFKFSTKDIHPIDQMEIHKKTGEMISSTLTNIAMSFYKLLVTVENGESVLLSQRNMIKSLEDSVFKIGYDPKDVNVVEEIIKNKNLDIATLRKQIKLLATKDPMT